MTKGIKPLSSTEYIDRYSPKMWQILLFSFYSVWQMGVIFFSSTALSVNGKTPLPVNADYTSLVIVAGYILSALVLGFFAKHAVNVMRGIMIISLISSVLMYFSFTKTVLVLLFYIEVASCVFMI